LTENINRTIKADIDLDNAINQNKSDTTPQGHDRGLALRHSRDMNDLQRAQFERQRQEAMTKFYGVSSSDAIGNYLKGYDGTPPVEPPKPPTGAKPTGGRAEALGVDKIPAVEFDPRTGKLIPEAVISNAKQEGIDAITTGMYRGKLTVVDKQGNIYDAGTYKHIGTTQGVGGADVSKSAPVEAVGADASDSDESTDAADAAEQAEIDKLINE
jgi:hypothetical protein